MTFRNIGIGLIILQGILTLVYVHLYYSKLKTEAGSLSIIRPTSVQDLVITRDSHRNDGISKNESRQTRPVKAGMALSPWERLFLEKESLEERKLDRITLLVAVFSACSFVDRRNAIRETWMRGCSQSRGVICRFFTDSLNVHGKPIESELRMKLEKESRDNSNDLILLEAPAGTNFATRLLKAMKWAWEQEKLDYFLRIDDDHYLCLDRLIKELPFRPRTGLYWGHLHCEKDVSRIDEGWLLLSSDIVQSFLRDREHLLCHPLGDQAVAMWIYKLMRRQKVTWFGDHRIHHHPPASDFPEFKMRLELCHTFLSLHGSYPIEMRFFDKIVENEVRTRGDSYNIPPVVDFCPHRRENFNWKSFDPAFHAEPVPCGTNPIWSIGGDLFLGRNASIQGKFRKAGNQQD